MNKKGFTLVELMVTMIIISILAAIIIPSGLGYIEKKREDECVATKKALASYYNAAMMEKNDLSLKQFFDDVNGGATLNGSEAYVSCVNEAKKLIERSGETYHAGTSDSDKNVIYCDAAAHEKGENIEVIAVSITPAAQPPRDPRTS